MAVIAAMPEMPVMPEIPEISDAAAKARDASKWLRKTKICVYYIQGDCKLGSKCNFAHSSEEVQDTPNLHKTQLCQDFENGKCNKVDCSFAHGVEELRISPSYKKKLCKWFDKGKCRNGDDCGFAHGLQQLREPEVPTPQVTTQAIPPPPGIAPPPGLALQETPHVGNKVSLALEGRLLDTKEEAPLKEQVNELSTVISMLQTTVDDMMVRKQISEMKQVVSQLTQQCAALSSIAELDDLPQPFVADMEMSVPAPPVSYTPLKSLKTKLKSSATPFVPLNAHAAPFVPMPESTASSSEELSSSSESSPVVGISMNSKAKPFVPCAESSDDSTSVGTDGFNSE